MSQSYNNQGGRSVYYLPSNARRGVSASGTAFPGVTPIVIAPDKDDSADSLTSAMRQFPQHTPVTTPMGSMSMPGQDSDGIVYLVRSSDSSNKSGAIPENQFRIPTVGFRDLSQTIPLPARSSGYFQFQQLPRSVPDAPEPKVFAMSENLIAATPVTPLYKSSQNEGKSSVIITLSQTQSANQEQAPGISMKMADSVPQSASASSNRPVISTSFPSAFDQNPQRQVGNISEQLRTNQAFRVDPRLQDSAEDLTTYGQHQVPVLEVMKKDVDDLLDGPTSRSQSGPNLQASIGGQMFQPQSLQPQISLNSQNVQLQGAMTDCSMLQLHGSFGGGQPQRQNLQQQASLYGSVIAQSQDVQTAQNLQPQGGLIQRHNAQQPSISVGGGIVHNANMNTRNEAGFPAQPCLQNQQLPGSAERQLDRPLPESRQTPEFGNSGMQHQMSSLLSGQGAQNLTARHPDQTSSRPASNQNSELNSFTSSQPLNRALLEMFSHPNSPSLASQSDGSGGSRSASASLLSQVYSAVSGILNTDPSAGNFPLSQTPVVMPAIQNLSQQQQAVGQQQQQVQQQEQWIQQQQIQQQQMQQHTQQQQQLAQQQLQQGLMQQMQQFQQQPVQQQQLQTQQLQQELQQQVQEQLQQQQMMQQLQSNFGAAWPNVAPVGSNQTMFATSSPAASPGGDLMSQILPFVLANLPMLNYLSQSFAAYSNPSLGGFNAFPMQQPQNPVQQQVANMLGASMAQPYGAPATAQSPATPQGPSGLDSNALTGLLYQMLTPTDSHPQTPTPPPMQSVHSQSGDAAAANMMQMMMQSLSGPEFSGCSASQQLLRSLPSMFGSSSSESGSRPGSVVGRGLDVSQLSHQLPLSIDEASIHSLVEPPPANPAADPLKSTAEDLVAKSESTKSSPSKQTKRKAKAQSPRKKFGKGAAGRKIKDSDKQDQSDSNDSDNAGEGDVEGDDDDESPENANPSVYIDVAWDPNCLPAKTSSSEPLRASKRVLENGRRVLTKAQQKKLEHGKDQGWVSGVGSKRKGGKADETQHLRKKGRMDSDEESEDSESDPLKTAELSAKGRLRSRKPGERILPLRSGRKKDTTDGDSGAAGKSRAGTSRGKAISSSYKDGGKQTASKEHAQESRKVVEERTNRPRGLVKTDKADDGARLQGGLDNTKKAAEGASHREDMDAKQKAEEGASHAGLPEADDSSNGAASDDNPGSSSSSSDSLGPIPSRESKDLERSTVLLLCTKNQPTVSMVSVDSALKKCSKVAADQERTTELLGVRKCRLKQLVSKPESDSDNDRHANFSDSSSSGDFGSSRSHWKQKSKIGKRSRGPPGGIKLGKRVTATVKKPESTESVAVAPDPPNVRVEEGESSKKTVDSAATTTTVAVTQATGFDGYARRGRGRPSLFQTFQSAMSVTNATAAAAAPGTAPGRTSPSMPVLIKETTVRAVARVSPLAPPPGDEAWKDKLKPIALLDSLNDRIGSQLQTVFVKLDESSDIMNVLISFKAVGDNMVFQCTFCPFTDFSAKVVSDHVRRLHISYMFAATRTPMPTGDVLYLFCRHCSFVTHDRISMWIHFEICHGIVDIVYGSDVTEVTPQVSRRLILNREQQAIVSTIYQCLDCDLLVADNRHVAEHAVKNHFDDSCYRGCFAKARVINKPKSAPIQVTYSQLLSDEYVDQRKEVFICVRCSYTAYTEFLAISHHIMSHLELKMLYSCHVEGCANREVSAEAAILHIRAAHADINTRILRANVTLVSVLAGDSAQLAECGMLERKDNNGKKKTVAQKASAAQPAHSAKPAAVGAEKSASKKGKDNEESGGESSEDSSQSTSATASKSTTDRKKAKHTSNHGPKYA